MPGQVIGLQMGYGFAGNVSRQPDCIIEAMAVKSNSNNIPFGALVIDNGDDTVSSVGSTGITVGNSTILGIAAAEVKSARVYSTTYPNTTPDVQYYAPGERCDVIKRGDVTVKCVNGTPARGGQVHVRTALNASFPAEQIGDLRTSSDSTNTFAIPTSHMTWKTARKDANNISELSIKTINR
jgi:hypothetical protein